MTGGAFIPTAGVDDYELDELGVGDSGSHAVQWVGTPGVRGPKWAKMPLLTVGMLGIQCVWSIEMGYASPYLLELGLSSTGMALVFAAGPLSGLIVQPLIGVLADRSKSRLGRRRPFMLAGCTICAIAMLQLGWAREISHFVGGGSGLAIFLGVWSIYLIDFSINAVMSTDRALVVDTLSPSQQEEGSAWAGRMFGFGSVAGFFIGNLDLPPVLPFLGKTQIQILSFLTSAILMSAHAFTSWAVTERVLLRDDRPQSKNGLISNLKAIWDNMFSLPPGIRSVCIVQFFGSLGWFPILFYTTLWVSSIYKTAHPELDPLDAAVNADAVRTGARALFFQSLINIACSIGLPFLVAESGVQSSEGQHYQSLNGGTDQPRSAIWKRSQEEVLNGGIVTRSVGRIKGLVQAARDGDLGLPIKGLTLVKLWWISQFVFAGTMFASWFVTSLAGAYVIIGITGFCWAMSQWAPYCLLGELILLEGSIRPTSAPLLTRTRPSTDQAPPTIVFSASSSTRQTPLHSRHSSLTSMDPSRATSPEPSPLIPANPHMSAEKEDHSLVLHHPEEVDTDNESETPSSPRARSPEPQQQEGGHKETADKAGVILGIHNVFLVLPQFLVTVLAAIIFHFMDAEHAVLPDHHPSAPPVLNGTASAEEAGKVVRMVVRTATSSQSSDAVGLIFRIGGVSAAIGAVICMRMAKAWSKGEGI